jgi:hypothetical protein
MINVRLVSFLLLIALLSTGVFAQTPAGNSSSSSSNPARGKYMAVSEVKEGMRGKALTVFRGTEPEEFDVEILGVVPGGIGPKQDLIIGRIGGGNAERTAVFAGMSGSPVYVDGRLVGAISYSFPFSKEAICGITPIEQMLSIFEKQAGGPKAAREPGAISFAELASAQFEGSLPGHPAGSGQLLSVSGGSSMLSAVAGQTFRPIGTPLTFTGISQSTLDRFAPELIKAGLIPVAAVGGAAPIGPMKAADAGTLQGGDSVSMQMTRGDISLAAAGTVTLRDGDKIYAFGHPFLSLGTSELPMSESSVVTVIPNINNSFKLAVPDAMVGTMTQDRATGVFGKLGVAPRMIPVKLNFQNSRGQKDTLNFEVARDDFLTPLLLNIAVYNSLTAQERSIGDSTIHVSGTVNIAGEQPVKIERRFTGAQAAVQAAGSVAVPVNTLLKNSFDKLEIKGIELDLTTDDGSKSAILDRLTIDRSQVKAGETVEITAFARTNLGRVVVQRIPITIPLDTPAGSIVVSLGDGGSIQKTEAIQHFVPNNLSEMIAMINKVKISDRLYLKISRTTTGAIIGSSELPNLPPSVLATISNDRISGGVKASTQTIILEKAIAPAEYLIAGDQSLTVTVVK